MVKNKYYLDAHARSIQRIGSTNHLLANRAEYHRAACRDRCAHLAGELVVGDQADRNQVQQRHIDPNDRAKAPERQLARTRKRREFRSRKNSLHETVSSFVPDNRPSKTLLPWLVMPQAAGTAPRGCPRCSRSAIPSPHIGAENDFASRYTIRAWFLMIASSRYVMSCLPGLRSMKCAIARNPTWVPQLGVFFRVHDWHRIGCTCNRWRNAQSKCR
jgi:hypothetical protein